MTTRAMVDEPEGQEPQPEVLRSGLTLYRENRELASELKFQVPVALAESIREWASSRLFPDPNATGAAGDYYHLCSLYFDTEHLDVFRRTGSFARSKYRIRRYGPSPVAFLERKLRTNGMVCKRRSPVGLQELERLAETEAAPGWAGFWYHQRLLVRQLRPVCQIAYQRTARVGANGHGPIRLTVDQDIRALPAEGLAFGERVAGRLVSDGYAVLELKYRNEMPVLFKQLVEQFALNPKKLSKYRLAMAGLGIASDPGADQTAPGESRRALCPNS